MDNEKVKKFPQIMGIINVTPDSFSDGGDHYSKLVAVEAALEMLEEGADIIDIGGESTRPGAQAISADEEIERTIPVIEGIIKSAPGAKISIDTTKYAVAEEALKAGASIINDVSGLDYDQSLALLAAKHDAELVLMHMQGTPRNMQRNPVYDNVVEDIYTLLESKINKARDAGVKKIIADFGIGFGKSLDHNLQLLRHISRFKALNVPLMIGISRKSFIAKALDINEPKDRDLPTVLIHAMLLGSGVDIIRVHNVKIHTLLKKLHYLIN